MKLNYYSYHFKDADSNESFSYDISLFLKTFCQLQNVDFKNSFKIKGRNYYLQQSESNNLFLLLRTNDEQLIKKINSATLYSEDIKNLLNQDEKIAFASYIAFHKNGFGIASPHASPKVAAFAEFINHLLSRVGLENYQFTPNPLIHEISHQAAMNMEYIGRSVIELKPQNGIGRELCGLLFGGGENLADLNSIEIIIKPKARHNIKDLISPVIQNNTSNPEVNKFVISAKNDSVESLQQYFLEGQGLLYNTIDSTSESRINQTIFYCITNNSELARRLGDEYKQASQMHSERIGYFNDTSSWFRVIDTLQIHESSELD